MPKLVTRKRKPSADTAMPNSKVRLVDSGPSTSASASPLPSWLSAHVPYLESLVAGGPWKEFIKLWVAVEAQDAVGIYTKVCWLSIVHRTDRI